MQQGSQTMLGKARLWVAEKALGMAPSELVQKGNAGIGSGGSTIASIMAGTSDFPIGRTTPAPSAVSTSAAPPTGATTPRWRLGLRSGRTHAKVLLANGDYQSGQSSISGPGYSKPWKPLMIEKTSLILTIRFIWVPLRFGSISVTDRCVELSALGSWNVLMAATKSSAFTVRFGADHT